MSYWNVIKNDLNMETVNTAVMLFSPFLYLKKNIHYREIHLKLSGERIFFISCM